MTAPDRPDADDPARRPRTLGQRLGLLCILLIAPVAAVTIPTLVVTGFFGQRPGPKAAAHPVTAPKADLNGLGAALNRSAESLLPTPAPLTTEPIQLRVRADHLAARAEKVSRQAQALGGSTVEGVSNPGEKHLYVDLPAGSVDGFRRALADNSLPAPPPAPPAAGTARDQLEVVIRPTADDE